MCVLQGQGRQMRCWDQSRTCQLPTPKWSGFPCVILAWLPGPPAHVQAFWTQSDRRLLGTNGGSLWLWCCLPQPGALGP